MIWLTPADVLDRCNLTRCPRCRSIYDGPWDRDGFDKAAGVRPCPKCSAEMLAPAESIKEQLAGCALFVACAASWALVLL